jgi:hypothetical protein
MESRHIGETIRTDLDARQVRAIVEQQLARRPLPFDRISGVDGVSGRFIRSRFYGTPVARSALRSTFTWRIVGRLRATAGHGSAFEVKAVPPRGNRALALGLLIFALALVVIAADVDSTVPLLGAAMILAFGAWVGLIYLLHRRDIEREKAVFVEWLDRLREALNADVSHPPARDD